MRSSSYVYVIGQFPIEIGSHVKIGVAKNPKARLGEIQTGNPKELRILGLLRDAGVEKEKQIHERFDRWRVRGEWFELQGDLYWWVRALATHTDWSEVHKRGIAIPLPSAVTV